MAARKENESRKSHTQNHALLSAKLIATPPPILPSLATALLTTRNRCLKLGTWNVRTLYQSGKLDNLIQEMESMRLDSLGIAVTHWVKEGKIVKENHTMIYTGVEEHRKGMGIL